MTARDVELAWAAGFFDGEGSVVFGTRKQGMSYVRRLDVSVSQAGDPGLLHRFISAVGAGTVSGPYHHRDIKHKSYWVARVGGPNAVKLLETIGPFLGPVKKAKLEAGVRYWNDYIPTYKLCEPHGEPVQKCHPCRQERAHKAWRTRRGGDATHA